MTHLHNLNVHLGIVLDQYIDAVKGRDAEQKRVALSDVMNEYIVKKRSDYENFMDPEVLKRYTDQSRECTEFVSSFKKKIWKPDRLRFNPKHSLLTTAI